VLLSEAEYFAPAKLQSSFLGSMKSGLSGTENQDNRKMDTVSDNEQTQTLSAEVKPLGELLQYQDGSIVSRVLLKNKGGTVTLFAFDKGEGLSEHTAPFEALVLVVDGEAEVEIAGKPYSVKQGETITLPANIPHAVRAATRFKMLLTMIRA
jgi:quercetin dioxygenase-like cupin family protein